MNKNNFMKPLSQLYKYKEWLSYFHTLSQQTGRVFILPKALGFLFSVSLLCLLTVASVFVSAELYIFAFTLVTLGFLILFMSNNNLKGVKLTFPPESLLKEGKGGKLNATLSNQNSDTRFSLRIMAPNSQNTPNFVSALESESSPMSLAPSTDTVGYYPDCRFQIESSYPVGFFRAWQVFKAHNLYIYPKPEGQDISALVHEAQKTDRGKHKEDGDFKGHHKYIPGETQRHLDWRALARGRDHLVKDFEQGESISLELSYYKTLQTTHKAKHRQLSKWIHQANALGFTYSLELKHKLIPMGHGPSHFRTCLKELCL